VNSISWGEKAHKKLPAYVIEHFPQFYFAVLHLIHLHLLHRHDYPVQALLNFSTAKHKEVDYEKVIFFTLQLQ
jgi:hypothetical protein